MSTSRSLLARAMALAALFCASCAPPGSALPDGATATQAQAWAEELVWSCLGQSHPAPATDWITDPRYLRCAGGAGFECYATLPDGGAGEQCCLGLTDMDLWHSWVVQLPDQPIHETPLAHERVHAALWLDKDPNYWRHDRLEFMPGGLVDVLNAMLEHRGL